MSKDIVLPKLYMELRNTLIQSNWVISHSDAADTYVVLTAPDDSLSCIIHYMPEAKTVYPNGSFLLKIRADEGTWKIQTETHAIDDDVVGLFIKKMTTLARIYAIVKDDIRKDPF